MTRFVFRLVVVVMTLFVIFGCESDDDNDGSISHVAEPDHPTFQLPTRSALETDTVDSEADSSTCALDEACEIFYFRACTCCPVDRFTSCDDRVQSACVTGQLEIDLSSEICADTNGVWDELEEAGEDVCIALSDGDLEELCQISGTTAAGNSDSCCSAQVSPGCNDANCETTVCDYDDYCCQSAWSDECAQAAGLVCSICGGSD